MPPLSAADCISPAFSRTKLILFSPFRKGRTWKLSATGYLATAGNLFLPLPMVYLVLWPVVAQLGRGAVVALVATCTLLTLLFLLLFLVFSRLQFAFFDIVLNREQFVAPLWRKHRKVYRSLTWLRIVSGILLILVLAAPIATFGRHLIAAFGSLASLKPGEMPPPEFFLVFYGGVFGLEAIIGVFFFIGSLAFDFVVPSLVLEAVPLPEAFRRFVRLIRAEPGQFALYCLLKIVLGFAGYMGIGFAFEIVILLVFAVVGAIAFLFGFLLHMAGVATGILMVLGVIIAVLLYSFLFFYVMFIGIGALVTFLEAYSLYFLAGRYPLLGEALARSTLPPQSPLLPQPWNPAYYTPPPV